MWFYPYDELQATLSGRSFSWAGGSLHGPGLCLLEMRSGDTGVCSGSRSGIPTLCVGESTSRSGDKGNKNNETNKSSV